MTHKNRVALATSIALMCAALMTLAPAQAVDCYPPGSCDNTQVQTYQQVPAQETSFGSTTTTVCNGGVCSPTNFTRTVTASELTISVNGGPTLRIRPVGTNGVPALVNADGVLVVPASGGVTFTVSGLKPGTWVDVYVNSDRVFLGRAKVGANGTLLATFPLPVGIEAGTHTAQLIGTDASGRVVSTSTNMLIKGKLLPGVARLQIYSARPLASWTPAAGSTVTLKAGLINVLNGNKINAAAAANLRKCSASVSVRDAAGKLLLPGTCMQYALNGEGKAVYKWTIPAGTKGKLTATFTYKEPERVAAVFNRTFTIGS